MFEVLKSHKGQLINLFDHTGGCLDVEGNYMPDWWRIENKFELVDVWKKFIILLDLQTNKKSRLQISKILKVEYSEYGTEITYCTK